MPDSYKELIKSNPDETEIRSFLVDGDQVSVTLRIPDTLRDAANCFFASIKSSLLYSIVTLHNF